MLTVTMPFGTIVQFSSYFPGGVPAYPYGGNTGIAIASDILPSFLSRRECLFPPVDIGYILGLTSASSSLTAVMYGESPKTKDAFDLALRGAGWGSIVSNTKELFLGEWDFRRPLGDPVKGENPVLHKTPCGSIVSTPNAELQRPYLGDYALWNGWNLDDGIVLAKTADGFSYQGRVIGDFPSLFGVLQPKIEELSAELDTYNWSIDGKVRRYRDLKLVAGPDENSVAFSYTYYSYHTSTGSQHHYQAIRVMFTLSYSVTGEEPEYGVKEPLSKYLRAECYGLSIPVTGYTMWPRPIVDFDEWVGSASFTEPDWALYEAAGWGTRVTVPVCLSTNQSGSKTFEDLTGFNFDGSTFHCVSSAVGTFKNFAGRAHNYLPDLVSTGIVSFKDAVDKHFQTFSTNHLETLSEVRDLLGPLAFGQKALRVLGARAKVVGGFFAILDLLADAKLLYSLGIAPTYDGAVDVVERYRPMREFYRNGHMFRFCTFNGKSSWDVPSGVLTDYPGSKVIVRSKVRARIHPDSLLPLLMPVRSLGLLPSLSTLWDLVPLSFILDYFIDFGSGFEMLDTSAIALALDIQYSVHSGRILYPFSTDTAEEYNFRIVEDEGLPAGYSTYLRWVDRNAPIVGPSRLLDFTPMEIPDWFLASSLIWKLLKF